MKSEKTTIRFIYIHELSTAIAKAILLRDHGNRFPNGVYELDEENVPKLDENFDPIYSDKAIGQMITDYHYYRDIIENHIVTEENTPPPKPPTVKQREEDTKTFIEKIKGLFRVFVF